MTMPDDAQRVEWEAFVAEQHAKGLCEFSGMRVTECQRSICDCFETPVGAIAIEVAAGVRQCGPHRSPQGPNEDLAQCSTCWAPTFVMRPENEQFGLHADDCSLPRRHEGYCQPGGSGHPVPAIVRGYWSGMDDDVAAARERFGSIE